MRILNTTYISFVVAGNSEGSVFERWELESKQRPRFGRNWWFWVPEINWNGGKFRSYENTDIGILWLCFSLSLTTYSWRGAKTEKQATKPKGEKE